MNLTGQEKCEHCGWAIRYHAAGLAWQHVVTDKALCFDGENWAKPANN